jgi:replication factor C subunit 2/4
MSKKTGIITDTNLTNKISETLSDTRPLEIIKKMAKKSSSDNLAKETRAEYDTRKELFNSLPWIEKHRPAKINNVKIDKHIKNQVEKMILNKTMPNIILEGPPGVGKTSTIKCIAREIYKSYYADMVLEMNASDDRGIKIQDLIENFRKAYVHIADADKDNIPDFKMVILDEADNMTDKAQHIISGFIGNCINDLRFAFTCNAKDNIISAIQSCCHIVKYPPLIDDIIQSRLREICVFEKIITSDMAESHIKDIEGGINAIAQITNGDMRFAINILQLTYNRFNDIDTEKVFELHDKPHPEKSKQIINCCINGDLGLAIEKILDMRRRGYSGTDIALGLRFALRLDICADIPEDIKIELWKCISYASYNISKGLDSSVLQITACVADMCQKIKILKKQKI